MLLQRINYNKLAENVDINMQYRANVGHLFANPTLGQRRLSTDQHWAYMQNEYEFFSLKSLINLAFQLIKTCQLSKKRQRMHGGSIQYTSHLVTLVLLCSLVEKHRFLA